MVRAKFYVAEKIVRANHPSPEQKEVLYPMDYVTLYPVIGGSKENEEFFKWSPNGKIEMGILNPEAAKQFEVGKTYYIDFTPAE